MMDFNVNPESLNNPYPSLFMTVSGAHLYGFPSLDSDIDIRGVHVIPLDSFIGLNKQVETVERTEIVNGRVIDLVSHDVRKFFHLLLKRNGYVLEQLFSPIILQSSPEHMDLKEIASGCITRNHGHHYLGFAKTQWELFLKSDRHQVKYLLYVYRVLLTGIHLMRTGEVEANINNLNKVFKLPQIDALIHMKTSKNEWVAYPEIDVDFNESEYLRLRDELESAMNSSSLPYEPSAMDELNQLLIQIRKNFNKQQ
jgi:predicted nucleotidyltransferase